MAKPGARTEAGAGSEGNLTGTPKRNFALLRDVALYASRNAPQTFRTDEPSEMRPVPFSCPHVVVTLHYTQTATRTLGEDQLIM
jgi:hypothetical protein